MKLVYYLYYIITFILLIPLAVILTTCFIYMLFVKCITNPIKKCSDCMSSPKWFKWLSGYIDNLINM